MALTSFLHLSPDPGLCKNQYHYKVLKSFTGRGNLSIMNSTASSRALKQDLWGSNSSRKLCPPVHHVSKRQKAFRCYSTLNPGHPFEKPIIKTVTWVMSRAHAALQVSPILLKSLPAIGIVIFSLWGLGPFMRYFRNLFRKSDNQWKKSSTYFIMTSYLQPMLLWIGATLICRALDPLVLPTEASQVVKQRLLNFVRSLSTVLALAYCLSSVIQQIQKFAMETNGPNDARNMGFQFAGKAVYTAVWVAAVSLFMELLGFSAQKWLTAGGLGTVLLTLAGREIFTNFLSSIMIHATRPFILNEWIQTKIEGYEVSGTVEHVGWWSPTIIRGEDREAVHIPNHKFTVNVVRNLSQKSHWRIKTHLAISHLDVNKINNIVADMRKVLAKNPHVEQQRLHRRVFLDNINPENQALLILVSCFVKTSHYEEYLCVKEAILLDLLRVISHHRARLATPIRTMQRMYRDNNLENVPFYDSSFSHSGVANRPLMLIEPSYKINGDDKTKSRPPRTSGDQGGKKSQRPTPDAKLDLKNGTGRVPDLKARETSTTESKNDIKGESASNSRSKEDNIGSVVPGDDAKASDTKMKPAPKPTPRTNPKDETADVRSSGRGLSSDLSDQKISSSGQPKISSLRKDVKNDDVKNLSALPTDAGTTDKVAGDQPTSKAAHESWKTSAKPPVSRPALDENIILGVALEGAKRTLPIEDEKTSPNPSEVKASAALAAEKDKKDGVATREAASDEK